MTNGPAYVILGRGRWARRMHSILATENRRVLAISETRRVSSENCAAYRSRLAEAMSSSTAQVAWLCVLPGPHVPLMVEAALDVGLHVVVEKPWQGSVHVTESLVARARSLRRLIAVHFEYCLLEEVERWREDFHPGTGLRFGGRFFLGRPDHTGMAAMDNLGSHLLAIRAYATPQCALQEIRCGYEQPDERCVWLERRRARAAFIDLLANKEPIIQRFIAKVEASLEGKDFPLDLDFASRVSENAQDLR
ncbi:MAG TPA: Gfo/Idh/MocA family oxidoreductase [Candidatus Acidoferrum sp.]|nr:Gfo/Idh/MocA family oxidoreductase [Candidatus Acidoferrum sp.]